MKWLIVLIVMCGCVSVDLDADHVQKERATYTALQPFVTAGIATMGSGNALSGELLNTSWDARITSYEKRLAERTK